MHRLSAAKRRGGRETRGRIAPCPVRDRCQISASQHFMNKVSEIEAGKVIGAGIPTKQFDPEVASELR